MAKFNYSIFKRASFVSKAPNFGKPSGSFTSKAPDFSQKTSPEFVSKAPTFKNPSPVSPVSPVATISPIPVRSSAIPTDLAGINKLFNEVVLIASNAKKGKPHKDDKVRVNELYKLFGVSSISDLVQKIEDIKQKLAPISTPAPKVPQEQIAEEIPQEQIAEEIPETEEVDEPEFAEEIPEDENKKN